MLSQSRAFVAAAGGGLLLFITARPGVCCADMKAGSGGTDWLGDLGFASA